MLLKGGGNSRPQDKPCRWRGLVVVEGFDEWWNECGVVEGGMQAQLVGVNTSFI